MREWHSTSSYQRHSATTHVSERFVYAYGFADFMHIFSEDWNMNVQKTCADLGAKDLQDLIRQLPKLSLMGNMVYKVLDDTDEATADIVRIINASQVNSRPRAKSRPRNMLTRSNPPQNFGLFLCLFLLRFFTLILFACFSGAFKSRCAIANR